MTPSTVTEINEFSGGMNNVVAPYLMHPSESVVLSNVDVRRGAMQSVTNPVKREQAQDEYFFEFANQVYFYPNWRSNVLWDNKYYWSDGFSTGKVLGDGTELPLGLPTPTVGLTGNAIGAGPHTGDFKYTYTFYDTFTGVESAPSPLTPYIVASDNNINLDGFEPLPDNANRYNIYRIGGYLPYFMKVAEILTTSYLDELDDTQIPGDKLNTLRNGAPPVGLKYLTEMNGRMYGAVGNNIYFSAIGNPDSWYIYDYISLQNEIRGLAKAPGGIIAMGLFWCNLLKGPDPLNFSLRVLSDKIGIISASSISYIDSNAIWLSNHGIVISDGYTVKQLTANKIENVDGLLPIGAVTLNNVYYMGFKPSLVPRKGLYPGKGLYPSAVEGLGGVSQGLLYVDFKRGQGYSYGVLDVRDIVYIDTLSGNIGITHGDTMESAFPDCAAVGFPECLGNISCSGMELSYLYRKPFGDGHLGTLGALTYLSPLFVDGSTTTLKEYEKVRILLRGVFKVSILFDNERVVLERTIVTGSTLELESVILGIPNADNKSYSIRFAIEGIGVIYGIQYSRKNRELP